MDLQTPEEEVVARLKDQLDVDIHVEAFPNNPETFDFIKAGGAVLVRYNSSNYSKPSPNRKGVIISNRTQQWYLAILHRNLKDHKGVYHILESVRKALAGYTLPSMPTATVLYPVKDGFVAREPGKWIYQIVFEQSLEELQA